jgi:uncharacterized protein
MTHPSEQSDKSDPLDEILPGLDPAVRAVVPTSPSKSQKRACPICKRPVDPAAEAFPFCTPRCRTADLAKWATGDYKFTRPIEERDLDVE